MRPDAPLRAPARAGEVWLHIDRFGKPNRRIWAVQYVKAGKPVYLTARAVRVIVPVDTRYYGAGPRQPKAVLVARDARVQWRGAEALIVPR